MARYIKLRVTAAKVSLSMALFALIAGIAEATQGTAPKVTAQNAAVDAFLKLSPNNFLKLDKQFLKLDKTLRSVEHKLATSYYSKHKIDTTFLKIDAANLNFLKITDANLNFLKITDANLKYLKIDGTAANANKLGNLTPDQFVQGHGGVLTGSMSISDTPAQPTAMMGDGSVKVLIGLYQPPAGGPALPQVTLENDTSASINFTFNGGTLNGSPTTTISGNGGQVSLLPAVQSPNTLGAGGQLDIQMFGGGGGAGKTWTLTVSNIPGNGTHTFVGQMLIGLL
jgi:hypothetical protein